MEYLQLGFSLVVLGALILCLAVVGIVFVKFALFLHEKIVFVDGAGISRSEAIKMMDENNEDLLNRATRVGQYENEYM